MVPHHYIGINQLKISELSAVWVLWKSLQKINSRKRLMTFKPVDIHSTEIKKFYCISSQLILYYLIASLMYYSLSIKWNVPHSILPGLAKRTTPQLDLSEVEPSYLSHFDDESLRKQCLPLFIIYESKRETYTRIFEKYSLREQNYSESLFDD